MPVRLFVTKNADFKVCSRLPSLLFIFKIIFRYMLSPFQLILLCFCLKEHFQKSIIFNAHVWWGDLSVRFMSLDPYKKKDVLWSGLPTYGAPVLPLSSSQSLFWEGNGVALSSFNSRSLAIVPISA